MNDMSNGSVARDLKIINEKGLHARASAKFVETVERFDASATVEKDGLSVSGDSIMGLLMLTAPRGSTIRVITRGVQAHELAEALSALVGDYFGEGM
ncbi:MAG TPA: HPr family phosphocarrier protein [Paracoccus sp. (in: a-proteobacteria)]|uniref:HPr family phosphocarrier protein n=1 Tax=Paracoccus sp. TaxID=267 RepID=UPI002CBF4D37|nr:HPr family phosphocarrier protein [Paracoccus sp. (in: a-proteobacteria)]HWL57131.1 HPr family phosphocarrier protein [Paracoccus sp. (in: a-proteobacteria)]